jgi:hypothetical protein
VAGSRPGAAGIRVRGGRPAPAGPAPRHRRRGTPRRASARSGFRHGFLHGQGRGQRAHDHDSDAGRVRRNAAPSRFGPRRAGRERRRRPAGRARRVERGGPALGSLRAAGHSPRHRPAGLPRPADVLAIPARSHSGRAAGFGSRSAAGPGLGAGRGDAAARRARFASCCHCSGRPAADRCAGGRVARPARRAARRRAGAVGAGLADLDRAGAGDRWCRQLCRTRSPPCRARAYDAACDARDGGAASSAGARDRIGSRLAATARCLRGAELGRAGRCRRCSGAAAASTPRSGGGSSARGLPLRPPVPSQARSYHWRRCATT